MALVAVGLLLTGCGHSSTTPTTSDSPSGTAGAATGGGASSGSRTSSTRPAVSASVAPPTPGSVHSTVKATATKLPAAVPFGTAAQAASGVSVTVSVSRVQITATQPGDTNGPGIKVDVTVKNSSSSQVTTQMATVTADGQGVPGTPLFGPPTQRLADHVAAGDQAQGHYFIRFTRTPSVVRVLVTLQPDGSTLVFSGAPK